MIAAAGDIACDPADRDVQRRARQRPQLPPAADLRPAARRSTSRPCSCSATTQYANGALQRLPRGRYDPTLGAPEGRSRGPCRGNHEYGTPGAAGYFDYFDGVGAGHRRRRRPRPRLLQLRRRHVARRGAQLELRRPCRAAAPRGSPQEQWLRADLAAHPAALHAGLLAPPALHLRPRRARRRPRRPLWQALYDAGADVVLNGHAHAYERFAPADRRRAPPTRRAASASSSSAPAAATSRASARSGPTARSAAAAPTACSP